MLWIGQSKWIVKNRRILKIEWIVKSDIRKNRVNNKKWFYF